MAAVTRFGLLPDGSEVQEVVIGDGDLSAKVITFAAAIRDVRLAGIGHPLVLGFDRLDDYVRHSPHMGAVAGRYANRIGGGRFQIDGRPCQLSLNENGRTHLHGGFKGFGHRPWRLVDHDGRSVTLAITSPDGDEGYPGRVEAVCRYVVEPSGILRYEAEAVTDAPTIVNLAQHSYFNLDDSADILDHHVTLFADGYTPTDADKVPTGEIRPVAGTPYDFSRPRPIRLAEAGERFAYDVNYVVARDRSVVPRPHARLRSPRNGVTLDIASTEPGVQFYDGCMMNVPVPGLDGRWYGVCSGCCFEPQLFPDSPNHPTFPNAVLRPGETYRQTTLYAFSRS
ncbi:MAG: galactose mutarotase [Bauldia sp.]|nr:MAG: galactose mutarotase [Bauldia sp.]MBZ0230615.1 galactose mutarotase [Bauldia sp.]